MEAQGSRALSPSMVSVGRQHQQRDADRRCEDPTARHPRFQHRLIRPSRIVAHRHRASARITLYHLLRKLRHATVQPRTLRNPAAAEAFSRNFVLIKQHRPVERQPVPRASGSTANTLSRYFSTFVDNTRPSATGQRFMAAASRNDLTTIARTPNPKPQITSAPRRNDAFPSPVGQVPQFIDKI